MAEAKKDLQQEHDNVRNLRFEMEGYLSSAVK